MVHSVDTQTKERVLIDESVMPIYRELRAEGSSDPEEKPFSTFKDIFMLAACLGFATGRDLQKLPGNTKTDIRETIFSENDLVVLKAIAISHVGDVEVLSTPGEILRIAEGFAHIGISEVKRYLLDTSGLPLWNLVDLVSPATKEGF